MDDMVYLGILFDYYGDLLTEKQQEYFKDYYFNNLSLSEISTNYNVSRNAVHKQLKDVEQKLYDYENCLRLYYKASEIKKLIINMDTNIQEKIIELI